MQLKSRDTGLYDYYFIKSRRGLPLMVIDNYLYSKKRENENGSSHWQCTVNICAASAILEKVKGRDIVRKGTSIHKHIPKSEEYIRYKRLLQNCSQLGTVDPSLPLSRLIVQEVKIARKEGNIFLRRKQYSILLRAVENSRRKHFPSYVSLKPIQVKRELDQICNLLDGTTTLTSSSIHSIYYNGNNNINDETKTISDITNTTNNTIVSLSQLPIENNENDLQVKGCYPDLNCDIPSEKDDILFKIPVADLPAMLQNDLRNMSVIRSSNKIVVNGRRTRRLLAEIIDHIFIKKAANGIEKIQNCSLSELLKQRNDNDFNEVVSDGSPFFEHSYLSSDSTECMEWLNATQTVSNGDPFFEHSYGIPCRRRINPEPVNGLYGNVWKSLTNNQISKLRKPLSSISSFSINRVPSLTNSTNSVGALGDKPVRSLRIAMRKNVSEEISKAAVLDDFDRRIIEEFKNNNASNMAALQSDRCIQTEINQTSELDKKDNHQSPYLYSDDVPIEKLEKWNEQDQIDQEKQDTINRIKKLLHSFRDNSKKLSSEQKSLVQTKIRTFMKNTEKQHFNCVPTTFDDSADELYFNEFT